MHLKIVIASTDLGVNINGAKNGALKIGKYFPDSIVLKCANVIKSNNKQDLKKNIIPLNKFNCELYHTLLTIKDFPIVIGGDHSLAISSVLASKKKYKKIGLIWVDAHADYNTLETTITGNIHGVPLSVISGFNTKELASFFDEDFINPENIVLIGPRSIDPLELENLKKMSLKIYKKEDLRKLGIAKVIKEALAIAGNNTDYIHISFDLDVLDPRFAPGVSVPEKNGLSLEEALEINRLLLNDPRICSYDLVEYNSLKDPHNITLNIALELINTVINIKSHQKNIYK